MSSKPNDALERYRHTVDQLDEKLVLLLADRFRTTREIGALKRKLGLPIEDKAREAEQMERIRKLASRAGVAEPLAISLYRLVVREVVANHRAEGIAE